MMKAYYRYSSFTHNYLLAYLFLLHPLSLPTCCFCFQPLLTLRPSYSFGNRKIRRRRGAVSTRLDGSSTSRNGLLVPWFLSEASTAATTTTTAATSKAEATLSFLSTAVPGPPLETKPDYESIHGPLGPVVDRLFQSLFRAKLAEHAGFDSHKPGFAGIIDIAAQMNKRYHRDQVQQRARNVLISLFPKWMPPSYAALFSRPFPAFSSRMNAWATWVAGTWLMGECELNDVIFVIDEQEEMENLNGMSATTTTKTATTTTSTISKNQGLLVKRCRFLEEAGCASVCVNSCKIPTQTFFLENMGLPLTMEPNYDTFECQFSFGKLPTAETESEAKGTPCLMRCPTAGSLRQRHDFNSNRNYTSPPSSMISSSSSSSSVCHLMGD